MRSVLLPRKPRPDAVDAAAIGLVFGSVQVTEPFFFRKFHHDGHERPEDEGQDQEPEIPGKEGYADADEHPAGVKRVPAPGIDAVGDKAVVLDAVVDLGPEEGVPPDEGTQQDQEDADD